MTQEPIRIQEGILPAQLGTNFNSTNPERTVTENRQQARDWKQIKPSDFNPARKTRDSLKGSYDQIDEDHKTYRSTSSGVDRDAEIRRSGGIIGSKVRSVGSDSQRNLYLQKHINSHMPLLNQDLKKSASKKSIERLVEDEEQEEGVRESGAIEK